MSKAVYGGAWVGKEGIKPDLAKLEAIVKWPTPSNAHELMKFLGLTGYFQPLIKDYAKIAALLTDLQHNLDLPQTAADIGKRKYCQLLQDHSLQPYWTSRHNKAFAQLKLALVSDPVLHAPKFDGTPFILTTDGCQSGFGAVLSQSHMMTKPDRSLTEATHPIGYGSKHTSPSEEHYKPYLLEFAALKYGFDHFTNLLWGFPVIIETDCIALRDTLCNDKLSTVHAHWCNGIMPYHIIGVCHHSGKSNRAADALSHKSAGLPTAPDDGSGWSVSEDWESS